ncbi:MAG: hypothetical protein KGO81_10950 [Bacteroidota bacterium]|nr:hypothetical protein [Bacteroidota bacterium]
MKRVSVNTIAKKLFAGSILVATLFLSAQVHAAGNKEKAGKEVNNVSVKYNGSSEDALLFTVKYSNPSGDAFYLFLTDENGEVLYRSKFNDKNFSKVFSLPRAEYNKVSFIVKNSKNNYEEKKDVNISVSTLSVDDVNINE